MPGLRIPLFLVVAFVVGCSPVPDHEDVVARLGDQVLTQEQLDAALGTLPAEMDSVRAAEHVINQWLTDELFASEARRLDLHTQPDVVQRLQDSERSVLAAAFLAELNQREDQVDQNAVVRHFEENRERMLLPEPFVRIRFVESETEEDAQEARDLLQESMMSGVTAVQDSLFLLAVQEYALDTDAPPALFASLIPQSRLAAASPESPWTIVGQMGPGETSPILTTADSTYLIIQLVERIPAGTEPELEWVREEVERSVMINSRRLRAARETERLRAEAEAGGELHIYHP